MEESLLAVPVLQSGNSLAGEGRDADYAPEEPALADGPGPGDDDDDDSAGNGGSGGNIDPDDDEGYDDDDDDDDEEPLRVGPDSWGPT